MASRTARLEVLQLGDRILPSVTFVTAPVKPAKVVVSPQVKLTTLSGSGHGSFALAPTRFGAGPQYALRATGTISGMGAVTVTGTLKAPALNATGTVTGQLVLTTAHGRIIVSLAAAAQSGRSALPTSFQYQIISSSGEFFGSSAHGTMHLALSRTSHGTPTLSFSF